MHSILQDGRVVDNWVKLIWYLFIMPSRSIMVWRLLCDKLYLDVAFLQRGFSFASCYYLCKQQSESYSFCLFIVPMLKLFGIGFIQLLW